MYRLLAIETSTEACSVALHDGGLRQEYFRHAPMQHAELLLPAIGSLMAEAGWSLSDLDAIAFGRGPGSFTSLRIGIGVVQGLAWGSGLPVVPVSSLAALAQTAAARARAEISRICVAVDARMNEVYAATYSLAPGGIVQLDGEERVCHPEKFHAGGSGPYIVAGNGFGRYPELSAMAADALEYQRDLWPRAEMIGELAMHWLKDNKPLPPALAQPVYLRNEVAIKSVK